MKKFLLILALLLIFVAYVGSYYTSYKDNAEKRRIIQETQERIQRTEEMFFDNGWDSEWKEGDPPRKSVVVVPQRQIREIQANQQRLLQAVEGLQKNAVK